MKKVSEMSSKEIKEAVKDTYAKVAQPSGSSCCGPTEADQSAADCGPSGCGGCGNPVAIASLKEGEVVLDLGSGAGLDMFHAAKQVGDSGRVIGVDMTPAMIEKAKQGAEQLGLKNVEFRLGDIEDLPVDNDSIDVIISNCVINLAPDKGKVFREAFRVLRPGGRVMVSDIVLDAPLPQKVRDEVVSYTGCLGGAILEEEYLQHIRDAGFEGVEVVNKTGFGQASSAKIAAYKPK
ncbi:MAG: arsenite methyltransferase [Candidatus Thorarchaeota archaeon]|jgi:SAM-dependent methyltransferase